MPVERLSGHLQIPLGRARRNLGRKATDVSDSPVSWVAMRRGTLRLGVWGWAACTPWKRGLMFLRLSGFVVIGSLYGHIYVWPQPEVGVVSRRIDTGGGGEHSGRRHPLPGEADGGIWRCGACLCMA